MSLDTPICYLNAREVIKALKLAEKQWYVPLGIACIKHLTEGRGFEKRIKARQGEWKQHNTKYKQYGKTKEKWNRTGKMLAAVNQTLTKSGVTKGMEYKLKISQREVLAIFRPVTFGKHLKKKPNASMKKRIFSLLDYRRPLFRWDRPDKTTIEHNLIMAMEKQLKEKGL
jgi:hypothetical protein